MNHQQKPLKSPQGDKLAFELRRKLFHLSAMIFPISYLLVSKSTMSMALAVITSFILGVDIFRKYHANISKLVEFFFKRIMRGQELAPQQLVSKLSLTGASYFFIGLLATCLIFERGLTITSWSILIISDCLAAIVGIRFGTPLANGKSLVGSGVFLTSAILISLVSYYFIGYRTNFSIIVVSSLVTTASEFYAKEINLDDNLLIPLTYALTTSLLVLFA